MPTRAAALLAFTALAAGLTGTSQAQGVATERSPRKLAGAPSEFPTPFSSIRSVTALPDGRLVISDPRDKELHLLDWSAGTTTPIARAGAGPREFKDPGSGYRARGGGVLVYDQRQQRFLPIAPAGSALDVIPLPLQPGGATISANDPDQFVPDTLGNLYSLGSLGRPRSGRDSLPLLRINTHGAISDTIARLQQQEFRSVPGPNPRMSLGLLVGFAPQDAWVVAPDGWVAVARAEPYRVDWFTPAGKLIQGRTIPHLVLPVTNVDREAARAQFRAAAPPTVTTNGETRAIAVPAIEPPMRDDRPPFPPQRLAADERGRIWIERSAAAEATRRIYDVVDRRGVVVDRIELPAGVRLVGFDARSLYTVRKDDDDLLHLQRYKLP
ncbi:MAG: hypothetical protein ABIZ70_10065 [Gemmatimonadales bacterium]